MSKTLFRTILAGGTTVALLTGGAWAGELIAQTPVIVQPGAPPVVVQPAPPPVVVQPAPTVPDTAVIVPPTPAAPQTLLADNIKANQVRAHAIYANTIKAREVQGTIHETKKVDVGKGKEDIKAPHVSASIIYADEIKADSVVANDIYVRKIVRD